MSYSVVILVTATLVATVCGVVGPFLVVRREALLGDAMSHAVLPGIVVVHVLLGTRAPLAVTLGAASFAVACVVAVEALRNTGRVRGDAAIGLVFPALFALGVLGIERFASDVHLDLDSTIYGEIALVPFRTFDLGSLTLSVPIVVLTVVALVDIAIVALLWPELRGCSFDPEFSRIAGLHPRLVSRVLLVGTAITIVVAFEAVGAILVVCLLVVPAATAHLLTSRLSTMVVLAVLIGWICALGGHLVAFRLDTSLAGAMGSVATACFACCLAASPRHGLPALLGRARPR